MGQGESTMQNPSEVWHPIAPIVVQCPALFLELFSVLLNRKVQKIVPLLEEYPVLMVTNNLAHNIGKGVTPHSGLPSSQCPLNN